LAKTKILAEGYSVSPRGQEAFIYHVSSERGLLSTTAESLVGSERHMTMFFLKLGIKPF